MWCNIKKIFFCVLVLICLLLTAGCGKDKEETGSTSRISSQYTLTYTAGENGSIDGVSVQKVYHGGAGSMVTAVPAEGYRFVGWSDGLTTPDRTDSNVTADLQVTAAFAINQYTLTYTAGENGTIDGISPQTVTHGGDASPVTAVPAEHHHFVSWSDGVTTAQRHDSKVVADLDLTATFAIDQYTLSYSAEENGTIDGDNTQKVDYGSAGSMVKAVPAEGYHFVSWSDGIATANRTDSDVAADVAVTATFAVNQYTITYSAGENGSIDGSSPQTVVHGGDASPVTAVPAEHHHFVSWSDGVTTSQRHDSKVTADLNLTATFAIDQYTLSYTAGENGTIDGVSSQKADRGKSGSMVKAVPAKGYHFVSWSDGIATANRTDSDVAADVAVTATFAVNQYTITYSAGENGSIEGATIQTVDYGGDASSVTAVAEKGYHFVSWSDRVTTAHRLDSKIAGDLTVSAVFEVNTYAVGGNVSGLVEGTQVVLQNNAADDLVITVNGDFRFATELLNASSYEVSVLTQPTSPNQTCTVTSGTGIISAENVTDVVVTCVLNTYTIGGTVSGIPDGDQVILQNNEGDDLAVSVNGAFTFATPLDDGSEYKVTVASQPKRPNWNCEVEHAAGSLTGIDVIDIIVDCYPEAVLQGTAGIRKIKLNWNSEDFKEVTFNEVTFNLCRAQENIPPDGFKDCQELNGGVLQTKVDSPHTAFRLTNDIPYWFQLEVQAASGRRTLSKVVKAMPIGGLNDTGIDWCADENTNRASDGTRSEKTKSCEDLAATYPDQDAVYGRDAVARARKLAKTGYGAAGFDFTKVCSSGEAAGEGDCPPNPLPGNDRDNWACIRDNVTGLTWEIKMDSGLRNQNSTYTWYTPHETVNGGGVGVKNGGSCEESDCDTNAYVQAVNDSGLCGANDWRMPTKRELLSIIDNAHFKPAVDARLFPNTLSSYYWTSSPYPDQNNSAWQVYFQSGEASPNNKSESNHIRLVRGKTVTFGLNNP